MTEKVLEQTGQAVEDLPADEVRELLRHFAKIDDPTVRWSFVELLRAFSEDEGVGRQLFPHRRLN